MNSKKPSIPAPGGPTLKRSLGFASLTLYGLGIIIGAGIYVLIGEVARMAGMAAPLAFLLAGVVAGLTGLSYAELVARHPEAAGVAAYVQEGFGVATLARLTGLAVIFVALIAAASIAKGAAGYLQQYVDLPLWQGGAIVVILFTIIGVIGVAESVRIAAIMTVIEISGLLFVVALASPALDTLPTRAAELVPADMASLAGVLAGSFVAFFAFIGFDTLANMAEETENPRALPRAILASVAIASLLYAIVALVSVFAVAPERLAREAAPLVAVLKSTGFEGSRHFAAIALIATSNGVMIEIMLVARLAYGMANRRLLPAWFGRVNPRTRTPLVATLLAGAIVLVMVVAVSFAALVQATSSIVLGVFALVNLSLWRMKRRGSQPVLAIVAPRWCPPLAALTCIVLLAAKIAA